MKYISFDGYSEEALRKQREECFSGGSNGEKLMLHITAAHEQHGKNVAALKHTAFLFNDEPLKKRASNKLTERLEQEQKWVKHYAACINEHKKGLGVYKIKVEFEKFKADAAKRAADAKAANELRMDELRKAVRTAARAEFEAELKAKREAELKAKKEEAKNKKGFWHWFFGLFSKKKPVVKKPVPVPAAANVAKAVVSDEDASKKDRPMYQLSPDERKKRLEELRKKVAERKAA